MNASVADRSNLSARTKHGDRSSTDFICRALAIWQVFDIADEVFFHARNPDMFSERVSEQLTLILAS